MRLHHVVFFVAGQFCGSRSCRFRAPQKFCGGDPTPAASLGTSSSSQKSHEVVVLVRRLRNTAESVSAEVTLLVIKRVFATQDFPLRPAERL